MPHTTFSGGEWVGDWVGDWVGNWVGDWVVVDKNAKHYTFLMTASSCDKLYA